MSDAARQAVVAEARKWLGARWVHGARVRYSVVDCGQLLVAAYEDAGVVENVVVEPYPQDWAKHRSEEVMLGIVEQYATRLPDGARPGPGDVVLFKYGRCLSHAAIVVEWPTVIHAYLNAEQVVLDDVERNTDLSSRLAGAWSPWSDR